MVLKGYNQLSLSQEVCTSLEQGGKEHHFGNRLATEVPACPCWQ